MTQVFVPSDQPVSESVAQAHGHFLSVGALACDAMEEYAEKSSNLPEIREQRAIDLLTRIAKDTDCIEESIIYSENGRVFCGNLDDDEITLEFFMGDTPGQDFFTIHDYMGLPNPRPVRSLYDLGHALTETSKLAAEVLQTFRATLMETIPWHVNHSRGE